MMDGYDVTILVDTTSQGQSPGTIYLIELDLNQLDERMTDAHSMNPENVLRTLRTFGSSPGKLYLIGCEPAILEAEDGQIGLSETVEASVPRAIELFKSLVSDLLNKNPKVTDSMTKTLALKGTFW